MVEFIDDVARMPIKEFFKLDPSYWSDDSDKEYEDADIAMEASKSHQKDKKEIHDGSVCQCDFDMSIHKNRPGIVLYIPGIKPVVCTICSTDKREDWEEYPNVKIRLPLKHQRGRLNPSHVAVNRFRYLDDSEVDVLYKRGDVHVDNLKEIKKMFIETNMRDGNLIDEHPSLESFIFDDDLDSLLSDI